MFDEFPFRVWLLILIAGFAYQPARYLAKHMAHAPSRRGITRRSIDLSWRTSGRLARNLFFLAALAALGLFIFTPVAEQFVRWAGFTPVIISTMGAAALFTVSRGLSKGRIEPLSRGISTSYERETQPWRFWASLSWNSLVGCLLLGVGFHAAVEVVQDRCRNEDNVHAPRKALAACNALTGAMLPLGSADRSDMFLARGNAHYELGSYHQAIADYRSAMRLRPGSHQAHYNRGLAHEQLGDASRAIADYGSAISFDPQDPAAYLRRGLIFLDVGQHEKAVADFTKAHELDPQDPWPLASRGLTYAWIKDRARAERDLAAVRTIDPENIVLLRAEALLGRDAGEWRKVADRLTTALKQDPDDIWSLRLRAEAYWELGEHEKSKVDDAKVLSLTRGRHLPPVRPEG